MLAKISKYAFEIIAGIAIFVAIIYFLPSNKVEIPDIGELQLETVDLAFVIEDEDTVAEDIVLTDTGSVNEAIDDTSQEPEIVEEPTITENPDDIIDTIIETEYIGQIDTTEEVAVATTPKDIESMPLNQDQTQSSYASCTTPRNTRINHGDSVLAYAQRSDDPSTCNVQRRMCDDGVLRGSYTQASCREYMGFDVQKQEVVTYNIPQTNPLVQPQSASSANTSSSQFIPGSVSVGSASRTNTVSNSIRGSSFTNSSNDRRSSGTVWDGTTCTTPRGEEVRNGQFVKAYKLDRGFSNLPCEVELRYCVQTNLEGNFSYPSCQHYDIAVEDYLIGHYDPNVPSLQHLMEILHGSADDIPENYGEKPSLWERVKGFFQRLF